MDEETVNTEQDVPPLPTGAPGEFKMPSVEELLKALDKLQGLSEENKKELRESILARGNENKLENLIRQMPEPASQGLGSDMLILFLLLTIVVLIFVFFGYKLYNSLIEREKKREEKKRQKQQKKKK